MLAAVHMAARLVRDRHRRVEVRREQAIIELAIRTCSRAPHNAGPLLLLLLYALGPRYALNGKSKLVTKGILGNRAENLVTSFSNVFFSISRPSLELFVVELAELHTHQRG